MSIKKESYSKYQKIKFGSSFSGQYKMLHMAAKEPNIDDMVKYYQCCKAIAKQSRLRYLFDQMHEFCFNLSRDNKDLFNQWNTLMKASK